MLHGDLFLLGTIVQNWKLYDLLLSKKEANIIASGYVLFFTKTSEQLLPWCSVETWITHSYIQRQKNLATCQAGVLQAEWLLCFCNWYRAGVDRTINDRKKHTSILWLRTILYDVQFGKNNPLNPCVEKKSFKVGK